MFISADRVQIFLDVSNLYHGLKKQFSFGFGKYSVKKLGQKVTGQRKLVSFNIYDGLKDANREPKQAVGQGKFHYSIKQLSTNDFPIKVIAKPLVYTRRFPIIPPVEKGIDARIVQDMIVGAFDDLYDVAILLSGDRDFADVVEFLSSGRFPIKLETYFPMSRRHLYEVTQSCFSKTAVITKRFYEDILDQKNISRIP